MLIGEAARGKGKPRHGRRVAMSERGGRGSAAPRPGRIYSSLTYWQKQMTPPSLAAPSHAWSLIQLWCWMSGPGPPSGGS